MWVGCAKTALMWLLPDYFGHFNANDGAIDNICPDLWHL